MKPTCIAAAAAIAIAIALAGCASTKSVDTGPSAGLNRIDTIVVIYAENHSFDNMYGLFPGANGVANASALAKTQLDHDGRPLPQLPAVYTAQGKPDARYPAGLPNGPFRIDAPPVNARIDQVVPSPIHNYYQNIEQINGGANNRFVAMTTVGAWTMGYYDGSTQKVWQWARDYTLADNFFMGAFGGSFLNHQWLVCACTPVYADAPASMRAQLDEQGRLKKKPQSPASVLDGPVQVFDGPVTPDGFVVNTSQPSYQPSGVAPAAGGSADFADPAKHPVPPQHAKTIGDTLSAKGVSWTWYAGGWNAAVADGRKTPGEKRAVIYNRDAGSPNFQPHHQPFNYFARFAPGTPDRAAHLKDGDDFLAAIDKGTLPQVAFYKPAGRLTQHPSYTDIQSGDVHLAELLERLRKSPQWERMAVIVTYDENGGYWDHVSPPTGPGWGDRWGPGTRIPTIVVSPFARRGYVDHTSLDTTSILKFITKRHGLEPLPGVRANTGDMTSAFAFDAR
ncbi:acid phosphatase [Noviherbaspirillum pedocola]|uniref:Acid phosphatase n=1 Tax=Noviherbaspirillum pedocola TaxID=2801341 RepID=A0A934SQ38_9BURK|nr:acid phosphatase [Noviherbaspirillum pedocola]MBK4733447.1 acid phosphatase [Noviherbaspirillum pedocola]